MLMGEVCSINGQLYTYQSREACRQAGGTAVTPASDANYDPAIPILPPPSRAEMASCWKKAIDDCVRIENEISKDHDLVSKLEKEEIKGLSKEEKELYGSYLSAARVLESLAKDLFRSAFINGNNGMPVKSPTIYMPGILVE